MKVKLLVLLIGFSAFSVFSQTIKIGYFQSAPFIFQDKETGEIKGAVYDFIEKEIAPLMGVKFSWVPEPVPIIRQLTQLESGILDASAMFAKSPERSKRFVYPEKPYFNTHPAVCIQKQHHLQEVKTINDLYGLKIGYCADAFISPFINNKNIEWDLLYSSSCIEQNLKKLVRGRIDCQYQPDLASLIYYADKIGVVNEIRILRLPEDVSVYMPFSKKAAEKYMDKYIKALDDAGGPDAFRKYIAEYIDISIFDD